MKKLLITSTDMMMIQFLIPHVRYLSENGFHVEIACSDVGSRMDEVRKAVDGYAQAVHVVRLQRSPVSPDNFRGYGDMKRLLQENRYDIIWTNEPVMGVVTRLAARKLRKQGTKVVYMVHGFHFFKGASLANWLLFYPVEWISAHFCDAIVTMNQEDYDRAQQFPVKTVFKIHGVGLDTARFKNVDNRGKAAARAKLCSELGLPEDSYILLSVGELTTRKNQEVIIRALKQLNDPTVHYILCGKGDLQQKLEALVQELGLSGHVHFLGYRKDIPDICAASNCFAFPSLQEGMPFALMEAMHTGLPIVCSRIRGNVDLIEHGQGGLLCNTHSPEDFCAAIQKIRSTDTKAMASVNRQTLCQFDLIAAKINIRDIIVHLTSVHLT